MRTHLLTAAMSAAAAAAGSLGTRTDTVWYHTLDKPSWQPPGIAFPLVWTPLYASIAYGTGRMADADPAARTRLLGLTAADLAANTAWSWAFFDRQSTSAGLGVLAVLNTLNVKLVREAAKRDRVAAVALTPYAVWCGFATLLNAEIWRRNR